MWRSDDWVNPYTPISDDEFAEWCGSHQIKGCGKTRTMCEDYCRPIALMGNASAFEAGADAMLESLEPLIRKMAPSSKLIDVLYKKEE